MANGLLDLLMQARESGRGARADFENSINYYIPPELRGLLGFAAEANPVVSMERAGQDSQRLVQPGLSGWERMAAAGDMASNMAGVLAPMAAGRAVGMPAVRALEEGLLGMSMTPEAASVRQFAVRDEGGMILPGSSGIDPATERGQEIMGMLSSGRAADITEDMFDLGDPVLNTRLNEYLYSNYDLPMDTASRMGRAQEMGAVDEYHGTTTGSDMRYPSSRYGSGSRERSGFFTSDNPYIASTYAEPLYGSVFPMMNTAPPSGLSLLDAGGEMWSQIPRDTIVRRGASEFPVSSYAQGGADVGGVYSTNQIARGANLEGDGGVRFENILDRGMHMPRLRDDPSVMLEFQARASEPSTVTTRQDTRGMRSRFARFDPRLSHLRNLNAALTAGVPLGLLAMQPEQERY